MHMTLLGALLALTPRPLYDLAERLGPLTALEDQHLGGAIMLLVGAISYLAGGLGLTISLLRQTTSPSADDGERAVSAQP
jgi:putative membrane protein